MGHTNSLQRRKNADNFLPANHDRSFAIHRIMWKGIGGNVGGIRYQIENGVNGFLVSSVEETAAR
jgi:trehalose synthase